MVDHRLDGQRAGDLAAGLAPHAVREHVELKIRVGLIAVFVVLANAANVGARAEFDLQRRPQPGEWEYQVRPARIGLW